MKSIHILSATPVMPDPPAATPSPARTLKNNLRNRQEVSFTYNNTLAKYII